MKGEPCPDPSQIAEQFMQQRSNERDGRAAEPRREPVLLLRKSAEFQPELLPPPSPDELGQALESLLFVASEPVDFSALARALGTRAENVEKAASELAERLRERGIRLQRSGGHLQLVSAPEWARYVERFLGVAEEQPLSAAAMETLAIIAYRQPATRATIESVRGVNSERALATLRSRGLIDEVGRAEGVGRPVLFGTTMLFLQRFGLEKIDDLPPLPVEEEL
jgi:segregation and condensation protein B